MKRTNIEIQDLEKHKHDGQEEYDVSEGFVLNDLTNDIRKTRILHGSVKCRIYFLVMATQKVIKKKANKNYEGIRDDYDCYPLGP